MDEMAGWHEQTLQSLADLLEPDPDVVALAVFGSVAGATHDEWSDIDLLLVVADCAFQRYFPTTDWLRPLGTIYASDPHSGELRSTTRVCFTDFRRLDLVITTESSIEQIRAWPRVPFYSASLRTLFSRSPRVDKLLAEPFEAPRPPSFSDDALSAMANGFWWKCVLAVTKVLRNDLLIALHLTLDLVRDCCVLRMLLRDRATGTTYHHSGGAGNDLVAQLDMTRFPYTAAGILDGIEQSAITFDRLAADWSSTYQEHRHPLVGWIRKVRHAVAEEHDRLTEDVSDNQER